MNGIIMTQGRNFFARVSPKTLLVVFATTHLFINSNIDLMTATQSDPCLLVQAMKQTVRSSPCARVFFVQKPRGKSC